MTTYLDHVKLKMFENSIRKGMACKLMSNVNKVASFSRLRNEHMPSNTLSRKEREIQHPLHREIENFRAAGFGLGNREKHDPRPDSNRRPL